MSNPAAGFVPLLRAVAANVARASGCTASSVRLIMAGLLLRPAEET
jgi:hypothetical protein